MKNHLLLQEVLLQLQLQQVLQLQVPLPQVQLVLRPPELRLRLAADGWHLRD